jgi:lysylphosphatidylglycerol synthetase-like protein (DUF2156 family)
MSAATRPFGITLLAGLHVLAAIIFFLGGIGLTVLGTFVRRGFFGAHHHLLTGFASLIGIAVVIVGLLYLALAWGLWVGRGWAWVISVVLAGLGIIISLVSLIRGAFGTLIVLILDAVIIYYLLTPRVRTFFGEYKFTSSPQSLSQSIQPPSQPSGSTRFCQNCAAPLVGSEKFCSHCGKPVI